VISLEAVVDSPRRSAASTRPPLLRGKKDAGRRGIEPLRRLADDASAADMRARGSKGGAGGWSKPTREVFARVRTCWRRPSLRVLGCVAAMIRRGGRVSCACVYCEGSSVCGGRARGALMSRLSLAPPLLLLLFPLLLWEEPTHPLPRTHCDSNPIAGALSLVRAPAAPTPSIHPLNTHERPSGKRAPCGIRLVHPPSCREARRAGERLPH
jgi:hypothetical protein